MKKRAITLAFVLSLVFLAGCGGEQTAREYASQLSQILSSYEAKIDKQVGTQTAAYRNLAAALDRAEMVDRSDSLDADRLEAEADLRDRLLTTEPRRRLQLDSTRLREVLSATLAKQSELHRDQLTAEFDSYRRFLSSLQSLDEETENVSKLRQMLADLSQKKNVLTRMRELKDFGEEIKTNYDKLQCDGTNAEIARLGSEVAGLQQKLTNSALSAADKADLNKAVASAKQDLDKAQAQKKAIPSCQ